MENKYNPKPIDVCKVILSDDLIALSEKLAENVHEIWAFERIKDGWSYGVRRDDIKKETPCLVRYSDLSEDEKKYDREVVTGILKTILKFGYTISREKI